MAKLTVKLHGEEVCQVELVQGNEYIAGRAPDAQIRLDNQRGISRQHLKFFEQNGVWVCESLSKFVQIQRGTDSMDVIELNQSCEFSVAPFDFVFESSTDMDQAIHNEAPASNNLPAFYQPRVDSEAGAQQHPSEGTEVPRANNDATVAGAANLVPYFRISFPNTADDEVLKLEGHLWGAGRDPDCEIVIDSPHVSRKHFELARTNSGYFVTDLGSSNGTKLNGNKIPPHEPTQLTSGDEIRVMSIEMTFEIRDTQFANRIDRLPVPSFEALNMGQNPLITNNYGAVSPQAYINEPTQYRSEVESNPTGWRKVPHLLGWQKNKLRAILLVAAPLLLVFALLPDHKAVDSDQSKSRDPSSQNSKSFEDLSKEQKLVVKDSFSLATNLYTQGKYALCLTELAKLHEIIPLYNNSKELQSFCEQGQILAAKEQDAIRQKRERELIESQVQGFVETCKAKLGPEATVDETRQCLSPAIELAPDHSLVVEMLNSAQMHEKERQFMADQKQAEKQKEERGVAHFQHAMGLYKTGSLTDSIKELERFVRASYPHVGELKAKAKRQIASIKKERKVKVDSLLEQCKGLGAKAQYRDAYKACDSAVKEDPSNHDAKTIRHKMLSELRREMKSIYEDSVLEESMGNVDTAKEKWKKIMQEDLEADDYTTKARIKLQKYGIGL